MKKSVLKYVVPIWICALILRFIFHDYRCTLRKTFLKKYARGVK